MLKQNRDFNYYVSKFISLKASLSFHMKPLNALGIKNEWNKFNSFDF